MQQHLRWAFAGRGAGEHLFDDLVLCVSELVTTAVEAGASVVSLILDRSRNVVRLAMIDHSAEKLAVERIRRGGGGHRARIIDAVASSWGVDTTPAGAEIWIEFTLDVAGSARPS